MAKKDDNRMARLLLTTGKHKKPADFKVPWATTYTPDFVELFCAEVMQGRSLRRIAIEEPWAPSARTIYYWLEEYPDFARAYHAARTVYADDLAKEIVEIADDAKDGINIESSKLQIHARQWLAAKRDPHVYGDRRMIETNVTSTSSTIHRVDVSHLTSEEIHIAEKVLLKAVGRTIEGELDDDDD